MEPRLYRAGAFAKRARVSVRTLRYYDREGVLSPTERSDSGHRLYSDRDLVALGRILGLKLMGFTLAEIRAILAVPSSDVADALARQRAMLEGSAGADRAGDPGGAGGRGEGAGRDVGLGRAS